MAHDNISNTPANASAPTSTASIPRRIGRSHSQQYTQMQMITADANPITQAPVADVPINRLATPPATAPIGISPTKPMAASTPANGFFGKSSARRSVWSCLPPRDPRSEPCSTASQFGQKRHSGSTGFSQRGHKPGYQVDGSTILLPHQTRRHKELHNPGPTAHQNAPIDSSSFARGISVKGTKQTCSVTRPFLSETSADSPGMR
jgi:hypothetical protein